MSIRPKIVSLHLKNIFPVFLKESIDEKDKNSFIDSVKIIIKFIAGNTEEMVFLAKKSDEYQELKDELIKVLFYDVIRTKDNDLLIKTADLWLAVFEEGIRLHSLECGDESYSNNPPENINELENIFVGFDIYETLRDYICRVLQRGGLDDFCEELFFLKDCFHDHRNRRYTDFNANIPIISAFAGFGNLEYPVDYLKKLISDAVLRFSGAEKDNYIKELTRIINNKNEIEKTIYENESINIDGTLKTAFKLILDLKYTEVSLKEFINGFIMRDQCFIGITARNKSEAGKIIKLFNTFYFKLSPKELGQIRVLLLNSRGKQTEHPYIKMRDDVTKAENAPHPDSPYAFKPNFKYLIKDIENIFEADTRKQIDETVNSI